MFRRSGAPGVLGEPVVVAGVRFPNRVGLAAGFDKDARWLMELAVLGFGSVEVGTLTPRAQPGNDRPRLFRLVRDRAVLNRMGFNNGGVEAAVARLRRRPAGLVVGGNIGKNKLTPNDDAASDYLAAFDALHPHVDYFAINVSSPNTPGLRALQERDALAGILGRLTEANAAMPTRCPILLKIAPDLGEAQLDEVADLALEVGLDGLVATNTSTAREPLSEASRTQAEAIGAGGLSGKPLRDRSMQVLRHLVERTEGRLAVIASGGIRTAQDARERLAAGAALVQVWTGFVYGGPATASEICRGLLADRRRAER